MALFYGDEMGVVKIVQYVQTSRFVSECKINRYVLLLHLISNYLGLLSSRNHYHLYSLLSLPYHNWHQYHNRAIILEQAQEGRLEKQLKIIHIQYIIIIIVTNRIFKG